MLETGSLQASVVPTSASITSPAVIRATDNMWRSRFTREMMADGAPGGRRFSGFPPRARLRSLHGPGTATQNRLLPSRSGPGRTGTAPVLRGPRHLGDVAL